MGSPRLQRIQMYEAAPAMATSTAITVPRATPTTLAPPPASAHSTTGSARALGRGPSQGHLDPVRGPLRQPAKSAPRGPGPGLHSRRRTRVGSSPAGGLLTCGGAGEEEPPREHPGLATAGQCPRGFSAELSVAAPRGLPDFPQAKALQAEPCSSVIFLHAVTGRRTAAARRARELCAPKVFAGRRIRPEAKDRYLECKRHDSPCLAIGEAPRRFSASRRRFGGTRGRRSAR